MSIERASQGDMDMAMELCRALEDLSGPWFPVMPRAIAEPEERSESEPFDPDDDAQCARVVEYLLKLTRRGSLMRVVYGMATLLHPKNRMVNPESDVLERHPDVAKALEFYAKADEYERLRAAVQLTIAENSHLADGDDCTLIHLVRAVSA